MIRVNLLDNSSTTTYRSYPGEDGRPEVWLGRRDFIFFVPTLLLSVLTHRFLLLLFLYLILFLLFDRLVCRKTQAHELNISYSHTDWYLLFSLGEIVFCFGRIFAYQKPIKPRNLLRNGEALATEFTDKLSSDSSRGSG